MVATTWLDTLFSIIRLGLAGLPIGIGKCQLLCFVLQILGVKLTKGEYSLGKKAFW